MTPLTIEVYNQVAADLGLEPVEVRYKYRSALEYQDPIISPFRLKLFLTNTHLNGTTAKTYISSGHREEFIKRVTCEQLLSGRFITQIKQNLAKLREMPAYHTHLAVMEHSQGVSPTKGTYTTYPIQVKIGHGLYYLGIKMRHDQPLIMLRREGEDLIVPTPLYKLHYALKADKRTYQAKLIQQSKTAQSQQSQDDNSAK